MADYAKPIPAEALKSLRLVMCQANHLSLDVGNCADCINPDACEKKVSEVEEFITELHQQKEKGAAKTRQ
ncbi:MAG: hypothetical protein KAQ66_03235 [Rhodospirillaceae bacterium]|nr:hypothetical protein [Rhodospirillaceae bacterium]